MRRQFKKTVTSVDVNHVRCVERQFFVGVDRYKNSADVGLEEKPPYLNFKKRGQSTTRDMFPNDSFPANLIPKWA